jgi:hypothetical protein
MIFWLTKPYAMKNILYLCATFLLSIPVFADTYTGVVSDVKHFHNGGVAVDLDGHYPNQKMALYVPPANAATVGALPSEGATVTATGPVVSYHGKPEIKIYQADQWKW